MFKSCRNLFNLSRKLGSVVIGLGLAGVLFSGQVSAAGLRWSQDEQNALFYVVEELVNSGRQWTWEMVAIEFNSRTSGNRSAQACLNKWHLLSARDERYARIHTPTPRAIPYTYWTDNDIEHLADVVRELVNSGRQWTWEMVAIEFNSRTSGNRGAHACLTKWYKLANQDEYYARIYTPTPRAIPYTYWTDEDIRDLADVVGDLVEAVSNGDIDHWNWDMVAAEFNDQTNQERTSDACSLKWSELAEQYEEFRRIYNPSRYNLDRSEAGRRRSSRNSRRFTPDQDAMLMRLVPLNRDQGGRIQWRTIAQSLNAGKSPGQCRARYRYYLQHINRVTQPRNHVPLPIPQINTPLADSAPTPITGSDSHATDTSNAATQYGQVLPGAGEH